MFYARVTVPRLLDPLLSLSTCSTPYYFGYDVPSSYSVTLTYPSTFSKTNSPSPFEPPSREVLSMERFNFLWKKNPVYFNPPPPPITEEEFLGKLRFEIKHRLLTRNMMFQCIDQRREFNLKIPAHQDALK